MGNPQLRNHYKIELVGSDQDNKAIIYQPFSEANTSLSWTVMSFRVTSAFLKDACTAIIMLMIVSEMIELTVLAKYFFILDKFNLQSAGELPCAEPYWKGILLL